MTPSKSAPDPEDHQPTDEWAVVDVLGDALGRLQRELLDAEGDEDHHHDPAQQRQHAIGSEAALGDAEIRGFH